MRLTPWKPFEDIDRFLNEDDLFLPMVHRIQGVEPAMDVYETDQDVIAEVNLPGMDPEKVEVSVEQNILRVRGAHEEEKEEKRKGYLRREIRRGAFERAVRLPSAVNEDKVSATYANGVLKIVMPKSTQSERAGKKITVQRA